MSEPLEPRAAQAQLALTGAPPGSLGIQRVRARRGDRRGAIILLTAFLMIGLLAIVAMAIDWGYIAVTQTELQRAADAGALAGASALPSGMDKAELAANEIVAANLVGNTAVSTSNLVVEAGDWNSSSRTFTTNTTLPSAVRVRVQRPDQPLFFGGMFGKSTFDTQAEAVAVYQPRDIMLVLDFSASMNDDSELAAISKLGEAPVLANLAQIHADLGAPVYGQLGANLVTITSTNTTTIKQQLGLTNIPYPYSGGSWDEYIQYNRYFAPAAYRQKFGAATFINYLLAVRPTNGETPDLWKAGAQPVTAVKDAVQLYLAQLQQSKTTDQIGFVAYTASNATALLESSLTRNFNHVGDLCRHRQAGHYHHQTNIGAGMQKAREELQNNARPGSVRMMVLMTDGLANLPSDTATARALVESEAAKARDAKIPIVTISLGAGADASIMQEVADVTGGIHFNIPSGGSVSQYEAELKEVFSKIAEHRPLQLVK